MTGSDIRQPAVAGTFYPDDADALKREVATYVQASGESPTDRVVGVVSPHAGIRYSGATAGHAFARCQRVSPARVVLLGCSHHVRLRRVSVWPHGAFESPMARFPIDHAFADALIAEFGNESVEAHIPEHSLELQLPFLAETVGPVPIVPVLIGGPAAGWHRELGAWLGSHLGQHDLVVCSTDLSHFLTEAEANVIDQRSLQAVVAHDIDAFDEGIATNRLSMCGAPAVTTAMACAETRGAERWQLLDYRTSAAASGDASRVVGYGALSMEYAA